MPFGAALTAEGVRFRLWAPGADRIELWLDPPRGAAEPMNRLPSGWFEQVSPHARSGSRYQFLLQDGLRVPDPASRFNPDDVHGPSMVIDPLSFVWDDDDWHGRRWDETVIYELHVGTFTPEGTFRAAMAKLDHLAGLGVSAINLMPVADFPGKADWGYDGVLIFAPDARYGTPDDFKRLVQAAHQKGLSVFLDVVYNHFGPEGNYLYVYAKPFFDASLATPWGDAINFGGTGSRTVREFFIHNALFWIEEYHLDGLRLDAVHAIFDKSDPTIVDELADRVHEAVGNSRQVHLMLENDHNAVRYLQRDEHGRTRRYCAQWNDDLHHVLHVLLTGETEGYYGDYAAEPLQQLGRCLCEGFAYQGEPSPFRGGQRRGEPSAHLPLTAFVNFLQNHDQVGNRAFGERVTRLAIPDAVRTATAILLLAPSPPMLFMGQEWGSQRSFTYFCDFEPELALKVTEGRRLEFARFPEFTDPDSRSRIPDPTASSTFEASRLDWETATTRAGREWVDFHRKLLEIRNRKIVPKLRKIKGAAAEFRTFAARGLLVKWRLDDGSLLTLLANLGPDPIQPCPWPGSDVIFGTPAELSEPPLPEALPAWSAVWSLREGS